jgi:hypothetical protein
VVRAAYALRVMANLRSLAISILRMDGHPNIAAANRHHARDPQRTLTLLQAACGSLTAGGLKFRQTAGQPAGEPRGPAAASWLKLIEKTERRMQTEMAI